MTNLSTVLLNVILTLTLACLGGIVWMRGQSLGSDGAVGLFLIVIPAWFLTCFAVVLLIAMGRFQWVPGGRLTAAVMLFGLAVSAAVAMWFTVDKHSDWWDTLAVIAPFAILAGCFAAVNGDEGFHRVIIAITLGTASLAGWCLTGTMALDSIRTSIFESAQKDKADRRNEAYRHSQADAEIKRFQEMEVSGGPLWEYLSCSYSNNSDLRKQCLESIARRPTLQQDLLESMEDDRSSYAAREYAMNIYGGSKAALAPGFGAILDRLLKKKRLEPEGSIMGVEGSTLHDWFLVAGMIQADGGDLTPQLKAWRAYLNFPAAWRRLHTANRRHSREAP